MAETVRLRSIGASARPIERRQFGRRKTSIHGLISARGRPDVPCVMRDVSDGGALLEVPHPQWCPSRFRLVIEANGFETECEIVHRTATAVGVRFMTPARF
jgi:PilZ domain